VGERCTGGLLGYHGYYGYGYYGYDGYVYGGSVYGSSVYGVIGSR
jgi:hypothetical protein